MELLYDEQETLDFLGLTIDDLNEMTTEQLKAHYLKFTDALNDGIERKSGGTQGKSEGNKNCWLGINKYAFANEIKPSEGSSSRYYDIDKWFEKNIMKLPKEVQLTYPCLQVPKPSKSEKNRGLEGFEEKIGGGMIGTQDQSLLTGSGNIRNNLRKNNHPTCKSIVLFTYLITLFSRNKGIVIDPFAGSGTTLISCELTHTPYIGFELDAEYCQIAEARIKYWAMTKHEREVYDRKQDVIEHVKSDDKQEMLF